jgi:antitoxin component YwqK of YwqJK toxin-antitoxin module
MKQTNLILFFIAILIFSSCNRDNINDSSKRNMNWVWWVDAHTGKGKWIPTGYATTVKDGTFTRFYITGQIFETGKYKDGIEVDTAFYYDFKAQIIYYRVVKSGDSIYDYYMNDGPIKLYLQRGSLFKDETIKDHKAIGQLTAYYENGNKKFQDYVEDTGWQVEYYEDGQLKDSGYDEPGRNQAPYKSWYENGQVSYIINGRDGIAYGPVIQYYENGQIKDSAYFIDNSEEGTAKHWYNNGHLQYVGEIKNNQKDGIITAYYESGEVNKISVFKTGSLINQKVYGKDGKLIIDNTQLINPSH